MPHNSSSNEINKSISQEVDLRMTFNQNEKKNSSDDNEKLLLQVNAS